jgi:alpha-L-fucosidase 2
MKQTNVTSEVMVPVNDIGVAASRQSAAIFNCGCLRRSAETPLRLMGSRRVSILIILALLLPLFIADLTADPAPPGPSLNLRLTAPIKTWDEAIPLGNGTKGVLLWGETNLLRLSLDRGDLWDERPSKRFTEVRERFNWRTMQQLVASNRMADFNDIYDSNYDYNGPPTKLPAGRVEITLDPSQTVEAFELNLATAEGIAKLAGGAEVRAFVNAGSVSNPVAIVRIPGPPVKDVRLKSPDSVKKLGYAPPRTGEADGLRWFEQEAADGFAYAVCAAWKRVGDATLLAVTVATRAEGSSPQAVAQARVEAALQAGYAQLLVEHAKWWTAFWERSQVSIPEPHILQHYYLVRYFYGAASRRGAPPMPLQGVWSADAGTLPPWKGDYHNDLNTQMTYLAYRTSGDFDEGATFLDYLWNLMPTFRQFARDFYDAPGAAVPGVMSLAGQPLGGWGQYSLSPTMGAWNAHLFYLHWRHTGDDAFLRERAYPFCREIGECLRALLKPDTNGVLVLPLSSSPEIFDNSRRAFLKPNSNYDLASLRMLFLALAEMAEATGDIAEAAKWLALDRQLGGWHVAKSSTGAPPASGNSSAASQQKRKTNAAGTAVLLSEGTLLLDETTPFPGSHRHLSNLMPLHPFNLITADGGERDQQIISASMKDWDSKGTSAWCGYSFSWMACLRARIGDAEAALRNLDIYARAFILRNGFHANGDQTKSGFSSMTYRPFTLEGNFLAMDAVHEMLLQSWNASPGTNAPGVIRLFPATPWRWHDASFDDLRAEHGHRISARRENNATTWFRIVAGQKGVVKIRANFDGRTPQWNRRGVKKVGDNFEVTMKRGEVLEGTLPKPTNNPPSPINAADPVLVKH